MTRSEANYEDEACESRAWNLAHREPSRHELDTLLNSETQPEITKSDEQKQP